MDINSEARWIPSFVEYVKLLRSLATEPLPEATARSEMEDHEAHRRRSTVSNEPVD